MKKIFVLVLSFLFVCSVKAEYVKYGDNNYVIENEFYCGSKRVTAEEYIESSGKLKVRYDDGVNELVYYIWNEDNTCDEFSTQDELDAYNSPYYLNKMDTSNEPYQSYRSKSNAWYTFAYEKATGSFDENETYYQTGGFFGALVKVDNPTEDDFENYYVAIYLKHPDKATYDANITYYTNPDHWSGITEVANDVTNDNIINYYVKTTLSDLEYKELNKKSLTSTEYLNIINNFQSFEFRSINNSVVFRGMISSVPHYYNMSGEEITKYAGYDIGINDNYSILVKDDNSKIVVYDNTEENVIYEKTYDAAISYSSFKYTDNSVIIYDYDLTGDTPVLVSTYINLYKPLSGDKQTYSGKNITIKFNGNYDEFKELRINDVVVPTSEYSVSKGSTIITIKKSYLDTLSAGTHTVSAVYNDGGKAVGTFTISGIENPQTADSIWIYISLLVVSLSGILVLGKKCLIK